MCMKGIQAHKKKWIFHACSPCRLDTYLADFSGTVLIQAEELALNLSLALEPWM